MFKMTCLYNLPEGADEEAFIAWRTGSHQQGHVSQPGVIRADFYRLDGLAGVGDVLPASPRGPYRFMAEVYWENREAFEQAWYTDSNQARLIPTLERITDAVFLIGQELQTFVAPED